MGRKVLFTAVMAALIAPSIHATDTVSFPDDSVASNDFPIHELVATNNAQNIAELRYFLEQKLSLDGSIIDINKRTTVQIGDRPVEALTLVHLAVRVKNKDALKLLLEFNADLVLADCDGNTPIHTAAGFSYSPENPHKNLEILRMLLESATKNCPGCVNATNKAGSRMTNRSRASITVFLFLKMFKTFGADVFKYCLQ